MISILPFRLEAAIVLQRMSLSVSKLCTLSMTFRIVCFCLGFCVYLRNTFKGIPLFVTPVVWARRLDSRKFVSSILPWKMALRGPLHYIRGTEAVLIA